MIWPKSVTIKAVGFPSYLIPHLIKAHDEECVDVSRQIHSGSSTYVWAIWAGMRFKITLYYDVVQSVKMLGGEPTDAYTFAYLQGDIQYPRIPCVSANPT